MPPAPENDLRLPLDHIDAALPEERPSWPGGYPDQVELALIDAVLSIRTKYGTATSGVRKRVQEYARAPRSTALNDLRTLAESDATKLGMLLDTTHSTAGTPKSVAIVRAAKNLAATGVRSSADLSPTSIEQKRAYTAVRGLCPVTWEYFPMLSHHPGVKADTWINRFVGNALGRRLDSIAANRLVIAAAARLGLSATELDYAIWHHMSGSKAGDN